MYEQSKLQELHGKNSHLRGEEALQRVVALTVAGGVATGEASTTIRRMTLIILNVNSAGDIPCLVR
jgi:hypothetical protein